MPSRGVYAVPVVALMLALVAVGCGSSGKSDPLKKPAFIQQANSICKNAEAERDKASQEASGELEEAKLVTDAALPPIQQMTEELGDLGPPVGGEKEVLAIIGAFEAGIKKVEAEPENIESNMAAFTKADKLAEDYGLTSCVI